jgi:tetratricopeptide (TPR) repeat protein
MAFMGFRRRDNPPPAPAPAADGTADLLARLALLDRDGFTADIVPWLDPARGHAVHADLAALARQGVVTETVSGRWAVDQAAATAAKNSDVATGVIDRRIAQVVEALQTILDEQRRGSARVASLVEMMRHAISVFEAFGAVSARGLVHESVWPVGQLMIWTVLELQAHAGPEQANQLATSVIARFRTNIGEQDKHALSVASALSSVHEDAKDWERAAGVLTWVCAGFARDLGPDAEQTITAEVNLANAYTQLGRPGQAAELLAATLARHLRSHADSDGKGPVMLNYLARAYHADGRTEEAIPYYVRAMAALAEVKGDTSGVWLAMGVELIKAYRETGDHDKADALHTRVTAAAKAKWGDGYLDPDTQP